MWRQGLKGPPAPTLPDSSCTGGLALTSSSDLAFTQSGPAGALRWRLRVGLAPFQLTHNYSYLTAGFFFLPRAPGDALWFCSLALELGI